MYETLSNLATQVEAPHKGETLVKLFREAVREREFQAVLLKKNFTVKHFRKDGSFEERNVTDMMYKAGDPNFQRWWESVQDQLKDRRRRRIVPTVDAFLNGELDFDAAAEETQAKMEAKYAKGKQLGVHRAQAMAKKSTSTRTRSAKAGAKTTRAAAANKASEEGAEKPKAAPRARARS